MIPNSLRRWFVVHFAMDVLFAVPLLIAPVLTMRLFGWQTVDPFTARLVGAALMAIGVESLLGRNAGVEAFRGMLNLKIIWSASAIIGMLVTLFMGDAPPAGGLFVAIFAAFHVVWVVYRIRLREGHNDT
jgi:hypothetical protein